MPTIGIDLGTTSSEACYVDEKGKPVIIPAAEGNPFGGKQFPSVVAFKPDGTRLVGVAAKRYPGEKIVEVKRLMGTDKKIYVKTINKEFTPQEISAFILQKIKQDAEVFLNQPVNSAVITVPAYFDDNQRQATKDAARIAGLEVKRIINEPTAAAIAYGLGKEGNYKVAVLDLGGGTFDVTIMEVGEGVFQVLATSGDSHLGGCDMDEALAEWIAKQLELDLESLEKSPITKSKLRTLAEQAKQELSSQVSTTIYVDWVDPIAEIELTRVQFEEIIQPVLKRLEPPIEDALREAGLTPADIDKVLLVGGATKVPAVRQKFTEIFGQGKIVGGVDPMSAVAIGAGIQAAVLDGRIKEKALLIDVLPLSLGVKIKGGLMSKIIPRNTPIPTKASKTFTTVEDFQTEVEVEVYQGEREFVEDNVYLGRLILKGIPPAPAGTPKIEVTFEVDENGIILVTAEDKGTGKKESLKIEAPHRLSEEEIQRMIKEAEMYAEQDRKRREEIEVREKAMKLIKAARDVEEDPNVPEKGKIPELCKALESALTTHDVDKIKKAIKDLEGEMKRVAEKLYGGKK